MHGDVYVDLEIAAALAVLCFLPARSESLRSMFHPLFRAVLGMSALFLALVAGAGLAHLDAGASAAVLRESVKTAVLLVLAISLMLNFGLPLFSQPRH